MAAKTSARSQELSQEFWSVLSYACAELCVIVLLHVAAVASYAATWLARVGRLRAPCTLCSRLDHALHGKPWFSADLVCAAHRSEISSLAFCTSHSSLARSDDLCKGCLLALGASDVEAGSCRSGPRYSRRLCSCCSEPVKKVSETGDAVESSHAARGPEEINRRSRALAKDCGSGSGSTAMPAKIVPEHGHADIPSEKAFVVGAEEVSEPDGASANAAAAKPAAAPSVSSLPSRIFVDRSSSIKNAFIGRLNLPSSPRPSEIISAMDNKSTTQQEVKALLSQMSSVRGFDSSWSEGSTSPRVIAQIDDSNARRSFLERNNSVLEPSDANLAAGEVDGEVSVESLKQQVELSRKSMSALYRELDEERSASAVAASQAMAMINRLHEEKAAMQMEALQYLRMMEEQADHDHEAIQNLHDLLTEREKELLDLDAELDSCRKLLQREPFNGGKLDATGTDTNVSFDASSVSGFVGSAMLGFEDEKAYILESLGTLEEKICNGVSTDRLASDDAKTTNDHEILAGDHAADEPNSLEQPAEESHRDELSCSTLEDDGVRAVPSLKDEVSLLSTRVRALEDDQEFLKRVLSSLKCSTDGLQCVQEITVHLQELRRAVASQ